MVVNTGAAILQRLIQPGTGTLSTEAAQAFLQLDFPPEDHERVSELSGKASSGTIDEQERAELNEYILVADLLAILQSKARRSLQRNDKRR
jgi:hypothetical protein